eukprot:1698566-Pyramimonas_sp.AAC.1
MAAEEYCTPLATQPDCLPNKMFSKCSLLLLSCLIVDRRAEARSGHLFYIVWPHVHATDVCDGYELVVVVVGRDACIPSPSAATPEASDKHVVASRRLDHLVREDGGRQDDSDPREEELGIRCEHLAKNLHSYRLLVEELPDGAVQDVDGEADRAQVHQRWVSQNRREARARCVHRLAMSAHQEEDECREEEQHAHKRVVERDESQATGHQQAHHEEHGHNGGGRLLLILLVPIEAIEHDKATSGHANQYLDSSEEGAETRNVPERHAGMRPRHALHNGPHAEVVRVSKLRGEANTRKNSNALFEGSLAHLRDGTDR